METVLMHTCCAPCSLSCIEPLRSEGIEPVAFWYNPNIHPWKEYEARRDCLLGYAPSIGMAVRVREEYGLRPFVEAVAGDLDHRCGYCYAHRLEETAHYAAQHGFSAFTTTLLASVYQRHDDIAEAAERLARAVRRPVPLPGLPPQLPRREPEGPGAGLLHAEVLRLRLFRGGALRKADRPGPGKICGNRGAGLMFPVSPNTLALVHDFLARSVQPGDLCVDATAGRGRDTALLCRLTGPAGRVLAFDIQPAATAATEALLAAEGLTAEVHLASHADMEQYLPPESVAAMVFNFGRLPGGDPGIVTRAESSLAGIDAGLRLLKPGGIMALALYYGGANGYAERDAILAHLAGLDPRRYSVLCGSWANRSADPPLPVFLWKDT